MPKPLLFISHKHADKEIATAISKFITQKTMGKVAIHQSSAYALDGPRLGANINAELNQKLWDCDTLLLIYTSVDNDWSYCMYECGVATNPKSGETRIIVFQCGKDGPDLYKDKLRVNVRQQEDINKFTRQLMTDPGFFPSLTEPLFADIDKETIETYAKDLFLGIGKTLPEPVDNIEEWTAWPFLRIQLPQSEILKINNTPVTDQLKTATEVIRNSGIVIKSDSRISQVFGQTSLRENAKFIELLDKWKEKYPDDDALWFASCCEQILTGIKRGFPVIKNAPLKEVDGSREFTPVLSRIKYIAFAGETQFDIYFYDLNDPRAVSVTSKMVKLETMFAKRIGQVTTTSIMLTDLIGQLDKLQLNRIAFLTDEQKPLYVIHKSMISEFILVKVMGGQAADVATLTLQDLLNSDKYKNLFESTYVLISARATMAEAKNAMNARPGCMDIFITANGNKDEPVKGLLTNNEITKS